MKNKALLPIVVFFSYLGVNGIQENLTEGNYVRASICFVGLSLFLIASYRKQFKVKSEVEA